MTGVNNMKKTIVISMMFLLIAGMAYAKDYEVKKKAGKYAVEVKIDKNPLVVGDNDAIIGITDASGRDVVNAKVELYYLMPSMPSMNYSEDARLEGNRYKSTIKPTMGGEWSLDVKFTVPGEKLHKVTFSFKAK